MLDKLNESDLELKFFDQYTGIGDAIQTLLQVYIVNNIYVKAEATV